MQTLTSLDFTVTGLVIVATNTASRKTTTLTYDAQGTANLLKEMGAIEDFTTDENGEPVILYTDATEPNGYGFQHWCDFVRTFSFMPRTAELILERRTSTQESARTQAQIAYLLAPLQAA